MHTHSACVRLSAIVAVDWTNFNDHQKFAVLYTAASVPTSTFVISHVAVSMQEKPLTCATLEVRVKNAQYLG